MISFADRFKNKAQIVGKQGEGAMLVEQQRHVKPKTQTPCSSNQRGTDESHISCIIPKSNVIGQCQSILTKDPQTNIVTKTSYNNHISALVGESGEVLVVDSQRSVRKGHDAELSSNNVQNPRNCHHNHNQNRLKQEPMKFGCNKYKGVDEVKPRLSDKYEMPKPGESPSPPSLSGAYEPYSVDDWRKNKDTLSLVKGGVGRNPSDTDKQRLYRVLQSRVKAFGCETREVNKVILDRATHLPKPLTPPVPEQILEKRERLNKMKEFAKNLPKPKVAPKPEEQNINAGGKTSCRTEGYDEGALVRQGLSAKEAVLAELEDQHRRDQEALEALKVKIGM